MKVPPELLSFLREEDNFFIATHINPDGDALGSALALASALESTGKNVVMYDQDTIPEFYRFLPGNEKIRQKMDDLEPSFFNLVLLDCNSTDRVGIEGLSFRHSSVIDHHESEKDFGDIKWIEPYAAATGMMIFYLIKEMRVEITQEIATNLYTAVIIDTGSFRYSNTTADVLKVSAELVGKGANPAFISTSLYEMWSDRRFALLVMVLNTLEIRDNIAMTFVTKDMFQETNTGPEDTENFANFPRMMRNVRISVFFRQTGDDEWKVSLRSKGDINVARIAELFGGGGHKNAAGCKVKGNLKCARGTILNALTGISVA